MEFHYAFPIFLCIAVHCKRGLGFFVLFSSNRVSQPWQGRTSSITTKIVTFTGGYIYLRFTVMLLNIASLKVLPTDKAAEGLTNSFI